MKKLQLKVSQSHSEVWIGHSLLTQVGRLLKDQESRRAFLFADSRLRQESRVLFESLKKSGWRVDICWLRAHEGLKSFQKLEPLYTWLIRKGADRKSMIFALGGGTLGDSIGFLAGTYLRGIPWVSLPSTLLSQVDSGLGGKTGVNHALGKNLIGVFHQPSAVICDLDLLTSLPRRELISGLGEVSKYGLILDPPLVQYLQKNLDRVFALEKKPMLDLVYQCLNWKAQLVQEDEFDLKGSRALLNFGHTIGHLLEAETDYEYFRHGEAVIWGMRAATYLSSLQGSLPASEFQAIDSFLKRFPVPSLRPSGNLKVRLNRLKRDKKAVDGKVGFVLLQKMGESDSESKSGRAFDPPNLRMASSSRKLEKCVKS